MAKIPGLNLVYEPAGKALEYSPLAINIFKGCAHGCKYCFGPGIARTTMEKFSSCPAPRADVEKNLIHDCREMQKRSMKGPVLLCFMTDPYQPIEMDVGLTRRCIEIFNRFGISFTILTKGGMMASRDFSLYKEGDAFATTLTFLDEAKSLEWEPNAALPADRIAAIQLAHEMGIKTWASMEPVIDTEETLQLIRETHEFVDLFKIGKINHNKIEKTINWTKFAHEVVDLLDSLGKDMYIKADLKVYLK
jgi:DNA repair photolyase